MNSPDTTGVRAELYALFGIAIYLEHRGIVEQAIPLAARILGCTEDEASLLHAGQRPQIEAWRKENATNYSCAAVERADGVFRLLVQHMEPEEAERALAWRDSQGGGPFCA